ncbi:GIY-YIG nuclease family protein [Candidatus Berkiella cookevillensis]|uniref:GIY-YIG nuclease family protein n=1 Tax=Candidatus Berkiella cookevillensis TaxID=437022 RepID=A0A0Q9YM57_9GAMM|nr:GIY-YIG nuclease family protein [Candidatus Berkiella cookevillensis]MCS5707385.1 GIY-YIG nuclease family protein [Candidatus Berkiella cookevillensis]
MDKVTKEKSWYLYIIQCRDNSLYTGISVDVEKRFREHVEQTPRSAKYLRGRQPLTLVFVALVGEKAQALKMENAVKRLSKQSKLKLIHSPKAELALFSLLS